MRLLVVYGTKNISMDVRGTDVVKNVSYLTVYLMPSGVMLPMQNGGESTVIEDILCETALELHRYNSCL